jgi:glutathione peroxidase
MEMKLLVALLLGMTIALSQTQDQMKSPKFYSFVMKTIDGKPKHLSDYRGKVLLVVNVASLCGYTPQYEQLEAVYRKYKDKGLVILGFPANNFGSQEPGSNAEIKEFCHTKYDVTFDMFSKISVKGSDQDPLYHFLTTETPFKGDVKWNFQKYVVDKDGAVVAMFPSRVKPTDDAVIKELESLLDKS